MVERFLLHLSCRVSRKAHRGIYALSMSLYRTSVPRSFDAPLRGLLRMT